MPDLDLLPGIEQIDRPDLLQVERNGVPLGREAASRQIVVGESRGVRDWASLPLQR